MIRIISDFDGIDDFIDQVAGESKHDIDERDLIMSEANSTIGSLWFGGESFGKLWVEVDGVKMRVRALGATVILTELLRALESLAAGAKSFKTDSPGGGYGVSLRFDQHNQLLRMTRTSSGAIEGPEFLDSTFSDFVRAVDAYKAWYHTEYLARASWLLRVEHVQQLRRDAGYPPEHL